MILNQDVSGFLPLTNIPKVINADMNEKFPFLIYIYIRFRKSILAVI
jgi:hypothetical protein